MLDYNFLVMTRSEYEERIRKVEVELLARQYEAVQPSVTDRLLYRVGAWLETTGARLKAHHQPLPMQQSYHSGTAR